ncbi:hypothetical protein V6N13_106983 [Hibiscus sabdariffa]
MAAISRANYGKRVGLLDAKIQTIGLFRVTWKKRHNVLPLHSIKNRARNKIPTLKGKCRNQRNPSGLRAYGTGEEQVGCRVWESASAHSAGVESSGASVVYGDGQLGSGLSPALGRKKKEMKNSKYKSDCAEAVKMVNSPNAERSSLPLVWGTARLRKRSWITNIHWIPRGSNQPADTLAKIVAPNSHDVVHLQSSPQALLPLLHEDTSTIPAITA